MSALHALDPTLLVTILALLHGLALIQWVAARVCLVLAAPRRRGASITAEPTKASAPDPEGPQVEHDERSRAVRKPAKAAPAAEAQLLDDLDRWRQSIRHDAA